MGRSFPCLLSTATCKPSFSNFLLLGEVTFHIIGRTDPMYLRINANEHLQASEARGGKFWIPIKPLAYFLFTKKNSEAFMTINEAGINGNGKG